MNNNIKRGVWVGVTLLGCLVLVVSAEGASFDCGKASTKVEHIICDNPEISKLDEKLSVAYKEALKDEKQVDAIRQTQKQWIRQRNACVDVGCVKKSYQSRTIELGVSVSNYSDTSRPDAGENSQKGQQYHFQLTKGAGTPVCDAYLVRLNTTVYEKPPYCDRPENDSINGFTKLNRVSLTPRDVRDLYPIVWSFMSNGNRGSIDWWADITNQQHISQTGQFRMLESEAGIKSLQMDVDGGWARIWRYYPLIDIDNDGVSDNVEVWHGSSLPTGVGGRPCGADMTDKFPGDRLLHQPQVAFVVTSTNERLDVTKTVNVLSHPSGGYRLSNGAISTRFRPIGQALGFFKYQDRYYFDTFFDGWGDFENKRQKDKNIADTLAVFLREGGRTEQVCEYLMKDDEAQNERGTK